MTQKIPLFGDIGRPLSAVQERKNQSISTILKKRGDGNKLSSFRSVADFLWCKGERAMQARREGACYYCPLFFSHASPALFAISRIFLVMCYYSSFYIFYMQYILSWMPKIGFSNPNIILLTSFIDSN